MNDDGSTNNLTDYFQFIRDTWLRTFRLQFILYTIWGFIVGLMMYFLTFHSLSGIIYKDGQINDYWNSGVAVYLINFLGHHLMITVETKNHTWFTSAFYLLSFNCMWLVIHWNDNFSQSVYQGNQWSMIFSCPRMYLAVFLQIIVIYAPRYIIRNLMHIVYYPEFSKVKGA